MSTLSEKNITLWSNNYLKKLDFINKDKKFVTDKLPHNFIRVGLIKILFPKAKNYLLAKEMQWIIAFLYTDSILIHLTFFL